MQTPANFLVQVQTLADSGLGLLQNQFCYLAAANKRYENFQTMPAQLGSTVLYPYPIRLTAQEGLVPNFEGVNQLYASLSVNQQKSVPFAWTSPQLTFGVDQYIGGFGGSAIAALGTEVEYYLAGLAETCPFRFYGDGVSNFTSFQDLAYAVSFFENYGLVASAREHYGFLSDLSFPVIAGSGQNQFTPTRNENLAQSWNLGSFSRTDWMKSNLQPQHISGDVGNNAQVLTVVSTNDPTGANITQITFSGASVSDVDAIFQGDRFVSVDSITGQPNQRLVTYTGFKPAAVPVQFMSAAPAASNGSGDVTVTVSLGSPGNSSPQALCSQIGNNNRNIVNNIVAGMKYTVLPSHRAGLLVQGDAMFLAMPQLPDMDPYTTSNRVDEDSGASVRLYYGGIPSLGSVGYVHDCIYGASLLAPYSMAMIQPL